MRNEKHRSVVVLDDVEINEISGTNSKNDANSSSVNENVKKKTTFGRLNRFAHLVLYCSECGC